MTNKSHHKSNFRKRIFAKQVAAQPRREPRRRFPCACCKYVMPVRYGKVFTIRSGQQLEVCSDCLTDAQSIMISHCANCGDNQAQMGVKLVDVSPGASITVCQSCFDSLKGISEHFDGEPHSDAESVF